MVARRRLLLLPENASNEGARLVRVLLRDQSAGQIARRLRCDEKCVRNYARGERPNLVMRERARAVLGIPVDAWDEEVAPDLYVGTDPPTLRA